LFVAVGGGTTDTLPFPPSIALVSSNGLNWTSTNLDNVYVLEDITYGQDTFVAVGYAGTILTTADGKIWTRRDSDDAGYIQSIAYGNGIFVAVGYGVWSDQTTFILTSPDAVHWTKQVLKDYYFLGTIAFGNGMFVSAGAGTILTSSDGINWTRRKSPTNRPLYNLTYGNGTFVATGQFGTILQSGDFAAPFLVGRDRASRAGFELNVLGEIGRSYRIQASLDLADWADLIRWTNSAASGGKGACRGTCRRT
jgi:hypothetical protein